MITIQYIDQSIMNDIMINQSHNNIPQKILDFCL